MAHSPGVRLKINFNDPDLTMDQCDELAQQLMAELMEMDDVEEVVRVSDPNPPEGNKALCGFLAGWLAAEVKLEHVKQFFGFLRERLAGKSIELEVEANNRKLKLKAHNWEELQAAIKAAQDFVTV